MTASLDRVREIVPVSGTGTLTLTGNAAPGGYRAFIAAMSAGQTATCCIVDTVTFEWEVCEAAWTPIGLGGALARTSVNSSSNLNNPVNFRGNPCDVFVTISTLDTQTIALDLLSAVMAGAPTVQPESGIWNNGGFLCVA